MSSDLNTVNHALSGPAASSAALGAGRGAACVPWALVLLAFVCGVALQLQEPRLVTQAFYAGVFMVFLVNVSVIWSYIAIKKEVWWFARRCVPALAIAAALALGFASTGLRALHFAQFALDAKLEGRDILATGVVAAMPHKNESGTRFRFKVEAATLDGQPVVLPALIDLSWYGGVFKSEDAWAELSRQDAPLRAGERWQITVRLKAPHGTRNPHGFDYELWSWEQGVQATGYVRATGRDIPPRLLGQTWSAPVEQLRQTVRDAIYARVPNPRWAGVIAALVVGDQNAIERADWDIYRATGVAHLMSISGLHITMFAWAAALLVGWLWRKSYRLCSAVSAPSAALVCGVVLAGLYALFSGWGLPAQRTVLMLCTVALLRLAGARWPWPLVWLLAMAVVCVGDPWALLSAGFWLSFVAVGVLFTSGSGWSERAGGAGQMRNLASPQTPYPAANMASSNTTEKIAHYDHMTLTSVGFFVKMRFWLFSWLGKQAAAMFKEQWVVTLALAPLSVLLFGQLSVVGLLANALAIPWVTLVVTPLGMAGILFAPLWDAAAWSLQALDWLLRGMASPGWAQLSFAAPPLWLAVLATAGGLLVATPLPWFVRWLGAPLLLPMFLITPQRPAVGEFELLAADIGQGNAVLVRTATRSLLYDAGPRFSRESDAGQRTLVPLLRAFDEKLDTLVISHRDADHIGGAAAVLNMQPQAKLLSSIEDEHELQAIRPAQRCVAGQKWAWDGVDFEILHPQVADYERDSKSNAMSCVLRISNVGNKQTALLTGDIEAAQEASLVEAQPGKLKADILLVPHHGSKTSSTDAFLDTVQPKLALVQAGYRNRFQHPVPQVIARYTARTIQVIDSPRCGAATWRSAAPQMVECEREVNRRYWQHDPR